VRALQESAVVCREDTVAYVKVVDESEATGSVAKQYRAARARANGVAEIIKVHSLEPSSMRASMQLYMSTTVRPDLPIQRLESELIATVVSRANDCFY